MIEQMTSVARGNLFPIQHSFEILERAQQGYFFSDSHIFFGAKPDEALKKTSAVDC